MESPENIGKQDTEPICQLTVLDKAHAVRPPVVMVYVSPKQEQTQIKFSARTPQKSRFVDKCFIYKGHTENVAENNHGRVVGDPELSHKISKIFRRIRQFDFLKCQNN